MQKIVHKLLWLVLGGGVLVVIDQAIKTIVWTARWTMEMRQNVYGAYPWLTWHQNKGISFGIELPYYLSVGFMAAFLVLLIWLLFQRTTRNPSMMIGLVLSIAGGASNLIDRIELGYVRDFVALAPWLPIFNFADVLVVGGVILILIGMYHHAR